jgi:hypothetical protein
VVGGAVGVTKNKFGKFSVPSNTSSSTPASAPLKPPPGLASANWTDLDGYQQYFVFHQDERDDIIESHHDFQNKTWKVRNVSASMRPAGIPVSVIKKTPIAAVAWSTSRYYWNIRVYVLKTNNLINEL